MKSIRLLKASRSFSNMPKQFHRYRVTQMNLIPKFGPGGAGDPPARPARDTAGNQPVFGPAATAHAAEAGESILVTGAARLWKSFAAMGELFLLKEPPGAARLAPKSSRRFVQPEPSLTAVKPVRNDLSDSDFEIRPLAAPAARESGLFAVAGGALSRAKSLLH